MEAEPGMYRDYLGPESVCILQGRATITGSSGQTVKIKTGDSVVVDVGEKMDWEIHESIRKDLCEKHAVVPSVTVARPHRMDRHHPDWGVNWRTVRLPDTPRSVSVSLGKSLGIFAIRRFSDPHHVANWYSCGAQRDRPVPAHVVL